MSWLNIFLVPDYLWLIAENFLSLDATLNLLATCKSIKAAGSDYLWNLRIFLRAEVGEDVCVADAAAAGRTPFAGVRGK